MNEIYELYLYYYEKYQIDGKTFAYLVKQALDIVKLNKAVNNN